MLRAAGPAELRAAYAALAAVADPDRAAWYRAAAAIGPDPGAADALAAAGERARGRSGHATAASALARAAELTPDAGLRAARRIAAAGAALSAGHADRALALLDAAGTPTGSLRAPRRRGSAARSSCCAGSPAAAYRLLSEAAHALAAERPRDRAAAGRESDGRHRRSAGLPPLHPLGAAADGADPHGRRVRVPAAVRRRDRGAVRGQTGRAARSLGHVVRAGATLEDPQLVVWAGAAAFFVGDEDAAVALHERAAARGRATGDAAVLPFALTFLATAHLWSGRPAVAEADAEEARRLAREAGQDNLALQADGVLAGIAALRGRAGECRELAERARAIARERGLVLVEGAATIALAELELALGAPDAAFDRLARLAAVPTPTGPPVRGRADARRGRGPRRAAGRGARVRDRLREVGARHRHGVGAAARRARPGARDGRRGRGRVLLGGARAARPAPPPARSRPNGAARRRAPAPRPPQGGGADPAARRAGDVRGRRRDTVGRAGP